MSGLRTTIGRLELDIEKLEISLPSPEQLVLFGISARCGRYLPFHLSTRKVRYDGNYLNLSESTLRFHRLPIGWFPHLKMSNTGHSGILPPTLSVGRDELRVGLPFYWLITPNQALTLTPGYHHHAEPTQQLFTMVSTNGSLSRITQDDRATVQSNAASVSGIGKARTHDWRLNLYGNSAFGPSALAMDPQLKISPLRAITGGLTLIDLMNTSLLGSAWNDLIQIQETPSCARYRNPLNSHR